MRVVGEKGEQVGVFTKDEALRRAQELGVDLVLVAPMAKPPVAKIIDFAKFKYQQQQKESGSRKKAKSVEIKEVRFTPFIAEGDYQTRIKKAKEFLQDGNKVRLSVKFVGRQITRKEFGEKLLERTIGDLAELSEVERQPNLQGKVLFAQVQPKRKK